MRLAAAAFALLALLAAVRADRKTYAGYQLLQTQLLDEASGRTLLVAGAAWDFWEEPRLGGGATIFASPEELPAVEATLKAIGIGYEVAVEDMQKVLAEAEPNPSPRASGRAISFTRFNNLTEIHAYLDELAEQHPNLVTVLSAGRSLEGRDLKLIKISSGGSNKRAIFIDATIHAREWIAPPVALYTINQLVENYEANKDLVDALDWYILPVLNPDGYEYTFTNERFWRKTRSNNGNPSCLGVDANRNFEDHWLVIGSSTNLCSETYAGPSAASEPETRALEALLRQVGPQVDLYLTLHSYGQYILHPWGYTLDAADDAAELTALGRAAAAAIEEVRGTKYTVGGSAEVLYYTSGSSQDWAKSGAGIKYSYTVELPRGGTGFDPPASAILPVVRETFEGIRTFGQFFAAQRRR